MSDGVNGASGTPSKAGAWKVTNRKLVSLPSGNSVLIRKLTGEFYLVIRDLFEKILNAGEQKITLKLSLEESRMYIRALVIESVIEPALVQDDVPTTDDTMHIADFGADLDPLVLVIQEFNGLNVAAGGTVQAKSFRAEADSAALSSAGEDLRGAAVIVSDAVAAGIVVQPGSIEASEG